ncbi:hypothetical protein [Flavobacterium sp. TSSA_36]|jgi:hypothetical protein|uniref:hypothetical protein n=1 Tax=Flavobacterium sp. TSSA_36 TaxID=3447669 RepID=UPI003F37DB94
MKKYLGQLISIEFEDLKEVFTGFLIDYSEEWILLRKNPVDFILDGFMLLKHKKVKTIHRDEDHEFTEKVIRLKGEKTTTDKIIPIQDLASIVAFLDENYGVFQIAKKSTRTAYLGKLIALSKDELILDFLDTVGEFGGELSFKPEKIRTIEFDTDYINSIQLVIQDEDN